MEKEQARDRKKMLTGCRMCYQAKRANATDNLRKSVYSNLLPHIFLNKFDPVGCFSQVASAILMWSSKSGFIVTSDHSLHFSAS